MKQKLYIAHSEKQINDKIIPAQPYETHVGGVFGAATRTLDRIEKYTCKEWFPVIKKSVLLAALYHDLGKLDKQPQNVLCGSSQAKMLNHVDAGVAYLLSRYDNGNDVSFLIAAYLVLAHHVGLPNYNYVFKTERDILNMLKTVISPNKNFRDRKSVSKYGMGRKMVKNHIDVNLKKYVKIHNKICKIKEPVEIISQFDAMSFIVNPMALKVAISILVDADHEDTSLNYGEPHPFRQKHLEAKVNLENLLRYVDGLQEKCKSGLLISSPERMKLRQEFFEACGQGVADDSFFLIDGTVGIGKTLALMRFSLEIFIEQWEIETNNQWSTIVSRKDISDEQKITMLKDVCVEIAYEKLRLLDAGSGIQISIGGMSPKDINIDRINWQQILDPDRGL